MTFEDLDEDDVISYHGQEYRTWKVEIAPDEFVIFADVALEDALKAHDDLGGWIDNKIAYYVSPDACVDDAKAEYLN